MDRHHLGRKGKGRAALRNGVEWIEERKQQAESNAILQVQYEFARPAVEALQRDAENVREGKARATRGVTYAGHAVEAPSMNFSLPCECGELITFTEGAAGASLRCVCGRTIEIPDLNELRQRAWGDTFPLASATEMQPRARPLSVSRNTLCGGIPPSYSQRPREVDKKTEHGLAATSGQTAQAKPTLKSHAPARVQSQPRCAIHAR
jgi:hypothetical protein